MQDANLTKIRNTVIQLFKKIPELDKKIRFVKRESKINAKLFAEALITGCLSDSEVSLERLCYLIKQRGVKITKQGLHQRFNTEAILLLEHLFLEALKQFKTEQAGVINLLKPFSSVLLIDSSGISLPSSLKDLYKGTGGTASTAGLKLQVMLDYIQNQISRVAITEGCRNDQGYDDHLSSIQKDALYLQDLGYFKLSTFSKMHSNGAYFISRYLYPTAISDESNQPINLAKELKKSNLFFTKNVWIGKKQRIKVRLIASRLPKAEVEKRIQYIRMKAYKRGGTPTKEALNLAQWSIFVTNAPEAMLKDSQIHLVYSLRWQIELLFKLFKSNAGVARISGKKPARILCEIYAKLICIATLFYVCFPLRWRGNQEISFTKAYKELKRKALDFFKALTSSYRMHQFISELSSSINDFGFKDKPRIKRPLTYQLLMDATGQEVLI